MGDSRKYCDWLEQSRQDLEAAKILVKHRGPCNLASFHAQQTVEKAYKAFILFKSGRLKEGHSLVYLNKVCSQLDRDFSAFRADSITLNKYYMKTRYPADFPLQVSEDQAKEFVFIAEQILQKVEEKIQKNTKKN
ncbi:HEPN domain-containing protein [Candidatus Contubernalis alkaliaceticus]|uniref:HEPN domain-containing protein n=1 Tax=Candidatus Contubernalis alkaliaceticus TaxID=338645 RepID=UPI001F4BD388|nr:HEPN domain-containing protein [Candidatus Contubernalis alkalaceticus]UNC91389.1 HEPN domain-containing protein [Candidatus Contubernalis alkalaceticus]